MRILFPVILEEDEHLGLMGISSVLKEHGYNAQVIKAEYKTIARELSRINNKKIGLVIDQFLHDRHKAVACVRYTAAIDYLVLDIRSSRT